jgi:hypothetical protein
MDGAGLPVRPCAEIMRPGAPADLAFCGLIGPDGCPGPLRTAICRENGWGDSASSRRRSSP